MFLSSSVIREGEHKLAWGAFALLFLLLGSHAMLETARDALFLSAVPASQLPVVYILVAIGSLAALRGQKALRGLLGDRTRLPAYILASSAATAGLWWALPSLGEPGLYVLYVWTGVLATLLIVEFWLALGAQVNVGQAKRLFAFVGTGSVLGAIVGFAAAGVIASSLGSGALLPASALILLVAALLAGVLNAGAEAAPESTESSGADEPMHKLMRHPYVRGVAGLVLVTSVTVTVADYIFKSTMAAQFQADGLAAWFAGIYLALNVTALVVQLFVTGPLVRWLGVTRSMAVLPVALSAGAIAAMLGLGLPAAIALKGADGTLKHTVNQTARELLFVPLSSGLRKQVKALIDVVGQRGGQALASMGILALGAFQVDMQILGAGVLVMALVWIGLAKKIQEPYLAVFRRTLSQLATSRQLDFPELDVANFEALIQALNSPSPDRVLAALEILQQKEKTHLIPALLLYHPDPNVVTTALGIFVRAGRTDFLPIADQLQGNANPTVHAALVRAKAALKPDVEYLRQMRESHCRATRTTAVAYLHSLGAEDEKTTRKAFAHLRDHENFATAEKAIAEAAPHADTPLVQELLIELTSSDQFSVADAAIVSMGELGTPNLIPALIRKLADRTHRSRVLEVLPGFGEEAIEFLREAMLDSREPAVRREIPGALGQFAPLDAVPVLLSGFGGADGLVKYRVIRQLERMMRAMPMLAESPQGWGPQAQGSSLIDDEIVKTLGAVFNYMDQRVVLLEGAEEDPARATDEHSFLVRLLRDKQTNAEERVIRLIGLGHPEEDFGSIWRGLHASDRIRASSLELLDNLLLPPLRAPISQLFDASSDRQRLAAAAGFYTPGARTYEEVLSVLVESSSASVSALAVAQVGALRLVALRPRLLELPPDRELVGDILTRTLALLTATMSEIPS